MQTLQGFIHALLPVPGIQGFDFGLQRIQIHLRCAAEVQLTRLTRPRQPDARHLEYRGTGLHLWLLGHIGHAHAALDLHAPIVGFFEARQNFQHGRFARAIAPNQTHALLRFQRKIGVIQQRHMAECQLCIQKRQ